MNTSEALFEFGVSSTEVVRTLADIYIAILQSVSMEEIMEENEALIDKGCDIGPVATFIFSAHLLSTVANEPSLKDLREKVDIAATKLIDAIAEQVAKMIIAEEGK